MQCATQRKFNSSTTAGYKKILSDKCEDHFQNLIKRLMLEIWSQALKKIFVPGTKACIFILAEKMRF